MIGIARDREVSTPPFDPPLPDSPTQAPPGSPEKIAVLAARYAAGVALWHPDDAAGPPPRQRPPGTRGAFTAGNWPAVRAILLRALRHRRPALVAAARLGCSGTHARRLLQRLRAELPAAAC